MAKKINWSEVIPSDVIVPKKYLEEQADDFNKFMQDKLVMECKCQTFYDYGSDYESMLEKISQNISAEVELKLQVSVPQLKGYRVQLLKVRYNAMSLYPCEVYNLISEKSYVALESAEFEDVVLGELTSPDIKKVIGNLLAQIV